MLNSTQRTADFSTMADDEYDNRAAAYGASLPVFSAYEPFLT